MASPSTRRRWPCSTRNSGASLQSGASSIGLSSIEPIAACGSRAFGAALGLVDADPVEPGEESRATLEAANPAPRAQERLLCDLLRLVAVCHEAQHHRVEPIGVASHQLLEGKSIAGL
jgi:hypothetical protein